MANDIEIYPVDETWIAIDGEDSILMELHDAFRFHPPGYQFKKSYRMKIWDGYIHLFNLRSGRIYRGLLRKVLDFAKRRNYTVGVHKSLIPKKNEVDIDKLFDEFRACKKGKEISPHDHQRQAVEYMLKNRRMLLLSPTASGKSLIAYYIIRWFLANDDRKVLLVVPSTSLVEQMYNDFGEYSEKDSNWNVSDHAHRIYSGKEKTTNKRLIITTWQSIVRNHPDWYSQFGLVIGDEAHNFKAKEVSKVLEMAKDTEYRMGMTGTLDGSKTHEMVLEGLFGPIKRFITTREMIDRGLASELKIDVLNLVYTDEEKKLMARVPYFDQHGKKRYRRMEYDDEMNWLYAHDRRNRFIADLTSKFRGNTLILVNRREHGQRLRDMLKERVLCPIHYIDGDVDPEERERVRIEVNKGKQAIIIASYKIFSTGISIENLHNLIFAAPSKAIITIIQSIGRMLRKSETKWMAKLWDICDDLTHGKGENYSYQHSGMRLKIFDSEKHKYRLINIRL